MVSRDITEHIEDSPELEEQEETVQLVMRKKRITPYGVFVVFLMFFVAGLIYANIYVQGLFPQQFTQVSNAVNDVAATLGLAEPRVKTCEEINGAYKFASHLEWSGTYKPTDKEYWAVRLALNEIDFFKEISNVIEPIERIQYVPEKNLVIYITSDWDGNTVQDEISVHAYNLSTAVDTTILKQKTVKLSEDEVRVPGRDKINDFQIMDDDNTLFIASTTKVWRYDIDKAELTNIPIHQKDSSVGFLYPSLVSPDGKTLLVNVGYWETSMYHVLDLQTGEFSSMSTLGKFPERQYQVLDWKGAEILYYKYDQFEEGGDICVMNTESGEGQCIAKTPEGWTDNLVAHRGKAYVFTHRQIDSKQEACNNVGDRYTVPTMYTDIFTVDPAASTSGILVSVDATNASGVPQIADIEKFGFADIDGNMQLVMKIKDKDEMKFALLDPQKSGKFIEIQ